MPLPFIIDFGLTTILSSRALEALNGLMSPRQDNDKALFHSNFQLQMPVWQIGLETSGWAFGEQAAVSGWVSGAQASAGGWVNVETDLDDYAPGSTATFTATGFSPGATLTFEVDHVSGPGPDGIYGTIDDEIAELGGDGHDPWIVTDGGAGDLDGLMNGTVVTEWYVDPDDSLGERFLLSVTDGDQTATATFTDAGDIDLRTPGSSVDLGGAIFQDAANIGSGTGNYNTFLALKTQGGMDPDVAGFNTDDSPPIDPSNVEIDHAKTEAVKLSHIPIIVVGGIEYYEFRVDFNEPNSGVAAQISLNTFKLYTSTNGGIESLADLTSMSTLQYDMDVDGGMGDVTLLMTEESTGSGTDDYAVLVPASYFDDIVNPDNYYIYLYTELGRDDDTYDVDGGFLEWNIQNAGILVGHKFDDVNGDGILDLDGEDNMLGTADDEVGIEGVTIFIDANMNGMLDPGERSTTTDMNGDYVFYGVPLGTHQIDEIVPMGATQTTGDFETVTIDDVGETVVVDPIGNHIPRFDIGGTKYLDLNGDGDGNDMGEGGLGGVTIFIDINGNMMNDDGMQYTTTTAMDGTWSFTNLESEALNKTVYEVVPGGYQPIGNTSYILSGMIEDQFGLDFYNFPLFDIGGHKYLDLNGDGDANDMGEGGLGGVTIFIDINGNMMNDDGMQYTTTTAMDGSWSFMDLGTEALGKTVYEEVPGGYEAIGAISETLGEFSEDRTDIDFYNFPLFDIGGHKYLDLNGDGDALDMGEGGLGGVTIFIDINGNMMNDDGMQYTTTTAMDGSWGFTDLGTEALGKTVYEEVPGGYEAIGAISETLGEFSEDRTDIDFYNFPLFDIGGVKYEDLNGDGDALDMGEGGLGGVTIFIDINGNMMNDDGMQYTTTTAMDGSWGFTDLGTEALGKTVYEEVPGGYQAIGAISETLGEFSEDRTDIDFYNFPLFDISGVKYEDLNANGMADMGEMGLGGVTIFIDINGNMMNDEAMQYVTTTAMDGTWSITGLGPEALGKTVYEVVPGGYQQAGTISYTLGEFSQDRTDLDFFNFQVGAITGEKYYDNDLDDVFSMGDVPLEGWTVNLYIDVNNDDMLDGGDTFVTSVMTDMNGIYLFNNLDPGEYIVEEVLPMGWTSVGDTTHAVTVTSGNTAGGLMDNDTDFLNKSTIAISGVKYEDFNGDGMVNGLDDGLEGWVIRLFKDGGDGVFDYWTNPMTDDSPLLSVPTNSDGEWSFNLNMIGTYFVDEFLQAGWSQSYPDESPSEGYYKIVVGYDGSGTPTLTIDSAQDQDMNDVAEDELNFLNWEPGEITGEKYYDNDFSLSFSMDDIPLEGWTVTLYSADADDGSGGGVMGNGILEPGEIAAAMAVDSTTTNSSGVYTFSNVPVGDYFVVETVPAGWLAIGDTQHMVSVTSGETTGGLMDNDTDFLNISSINISGTKYEDFNADGLVNGSDAGLENWEIYIFFDANGNGMFDMGEPETTVMTDMNGDWDIDLPFIGDYYVSEVLQAGWSQSYPGETPTEGFYKVTVGYDGSGTPTLTIDDAEDQDMNDVSSDALDFLNWEPGSIAGKKFWDDNQNGIVDMGETFANFWEIELYDDSGSMAGVFDAGDQLITSVMTAGDGDFLFDNLDPGIYHLVEVLQDGFAQTTPSSGVITVEVLSGADIGPDVDMSGTLEEGDILFGNFRIPGNGVRTPGFWKSPLGKTFYDGVLDNQGDVGNSDGDNKDFDEEGWPEIDLLETYGVDTDPGDNGVPNMSDNDEFALRDMNMNGIEDEGDLFLTPQELCEWLEGGGGQHGPRNGWDTIARDVAAAYLNKLNGNDLGNPMDPNDPAFWLEEGIDFLLEFDGMLVRTNSAAWKTGTNKDGGGIDPTGPDIAAGGDIHNVLSMFNESGEMMMTMTTLTATTTVTSSFLQQVNFDGDDWALAVAQDWAQKHQEAPSGSAELVSVTMALTAPDSGDDGFVDNATAQASYSEPPWKLDGTLLLA